MRSWIRAREVPDLGAVEGIGPIVAEAVAEMHGRSGGGLDRLVDQLRAAEFQKAAVADVGFGRPSQQGQPFWAALELPQLFAGAVPVDQEDQARAEEFEVGSHAGGVGGDKAAGGHEERFAGGQGGGALGVPGGAAGFQHVLEKRQAFGVHVGVGDADGLVLHVNDDDVGVGGADVVLDDQAVAGPRGGGGEAGMVELQFGGAVEAGHEGCDQGAIGFVEVVGGGAVEGFFGEVGLQGVELLVQVHHQPVQAVGVAMAGAHHRRGGGGIEQVVCCGRQGLQQLFQPCGEAGGFGCEHRGGHQAHVFGDAGEDPGGAGDTAGFADHARRRDDAVEIGIVDAAGDALLLQACG